MLLVILMEKKILKGFTKMNFRKKKKKKKRKENQTEFRVEKVIKSKGDKLNVKWKGCDSSFNSWIEKKRHNIN